MVEPRAHDRHILAVCESDFARKLGRESDDVVRPEDRLDLRRIRLVQVFFASALKAIDVLQHRSRLRRDRDVCAVSLEFLIDLLADVEHDVEHGGGERYAESRRQRDEEEALPLANQRALYHLPKHCIPPSRISGTRRAPCPRRPAARAACRPPRCIRAESGCSRPSCRSSPCSS